MTRNGPSIADYFLAPVEARRRRHQRVNVTCRLPRLRYLRRDHRARIAALAIYALLDPALKGAEIRRIKALRPTVESRCATAAAGRRDAGVLLPLSLVVGAYGFLRGHNQPRRRLRRRPDRRDRLIMQYIASGYGWAAERLRVDGQGVIGAGVVIAGLTGLAAFAFGRPFLTSTFGYLDWPGRSASSRWPPPWPSISGCSSRSSVSRSCRSPNCRVSPAASIRDGQPGADGRAARTTCRRREGGVGHGNPRRRRHRHPDVRRRLPADAGPHVPVIIGLTFLSYAVNLFLFSMGRLVIDRPPVISPAAADTPIPAPGAGADRHCHLLPA